MEGSAHEHSRQGDVRRRRRVDQQDRTDYKLGDVVAAALKAGPRTSSTGFFAG